MLYKIYFKFLRFLPLRFKFLALNFFKKQRFFLHHEMNYSTNLSIHNTALT